MENVLLEKNSLINLLQKIDDISLIQKIRDFVIHEIEPISLTENQKIELNTRLSEHYNNPNNGVNAFDFLDNLKSKYDL